MIGEPIAKIDITRYTTAEELNSLLGNLMYSDRWEIQRVPNPDKEEDEPDFYLNRKQGDNDD